MYRDSSLTTRIHDPPAPPFWFRAIFYSCALAWLALQAITAGYDIQTLELYAYTHLFDSNLERRIDALFVNIIVITLLTVGLAIVFAYGMLTKSKLTVAGCAAFAIVLWILNMLCIGQIYASSFMLNYGPSSQNSRQLTVFHENMSTKHWTAEIKKFAKHYPLNLPVPTPDYGLQSPETTAVMLHDNGTTPSGGAAVGSGSNTGAVNTTEPSRRRRAVDGNTTATAAADSATSNITGTASSGGTTASPRIHVDVLLPFEVNRTAKLLKWYIQQEAAFLTTLGFVQRAGYCCGVDSYKDYRKYGARIPISCRCNKTTTKTMHVECSRKGYHLMNLGNWAVWNRSCSDVLEQFAMNLVHLGRLMVVTVVPHTFVAFMSVVLAINMPSVTKNDSADDY